MKSSDSPDTKVAASSPRDVQTEPPHDFDVQRKVHQQIRNDPDYDDWEYGTEPLPHEAWVARQKPATEGGDAA